MKKTKLSLAIPAAGLVVAGVAGYAVASSGIGEDDDTRHYPTTPDGRTFGDLPTDNGPLPVEKIPDLVGVVGDNGVEGYAKAEDLDGPGPEPTSPEEALRLQDEAPAEWIVPVYAEDGITQIDTFTVAGPRSDEIVVTDENGDTYDLND